MLVAIVALQQYAELHGGQYRSTVQLWVKRAKRHYLLANIALVGEAIMLAMRTHR